MTPDQLEKLVLFHIESQMQNIIDIRNWIFQLTIMSGGVIGFTLPVLGASSLVKNACFLIVGLFLLWLDIILGFGYLRRVLSSENNKLTKQWEEIKKDNGVKTETKGGTKYDILDVLYGIFILATLAIILSLIDF